MIRIASLALVLGVAAVFVGEVRASLAAPADATPSPRSAEIGLVSDRGGYLHVAWEMSPRMAAMTIEIASQPNTDWGGFFWAQNVVLVERLHPASVQWDSQERLKPGTYWVHVQTFDADCAGDVAMYDKVTCITWSRAVRGTIEQPENLPPENLPPELKFVRWASRAGDALMRVCDDTEAPPLVFQTTVSVKRFGHRSETRRRTQRADDTPPSRDGDVACATYNVALPSLSGLGRYTMTMTVTDSRGARSNRVVKRWTTTH